MELEQIKGLVSGMGHELKASKAGSVTFEARLTGFVLDPYTFSLLASLTTLAAVVGITLALPSPGAVMSLIVVAAMAIAMCLRFFSYRRSYHRIIFDLSQGTIIITEVYGLSLARKAGLSMADIMAAYLEDNSEQDQSKDPTIVIYWKNQIQPAFFLHFHESQGREAFVQGLVRCQVPIKPSDELIHDNKDSVPRAIATDSHTHHQG